MIEIKEEDIKITKISYSDNWETAEVGKKECVKIEEHRSQGEGDKWYYDIYFKNDDIIRTFTPDKVFYKNIKVEEVKS